MKISIELAKKLIATQFPHYADLTVSEVEKQGHDNRTYRIGDDMLIRMPTAESYALKALNAYRHCEERKRRGNLEIILCSNLAYILWLPTEMELYILESHQI